MNELRKICIKTISVVISALAIGACSDKTVEWPHAMGPATGLVQESTQLPTSPKSEASIQSALATEQDAHDAVQSLNKNITELDATVKKSIDGNVDQKILQQRKSYVQALYEKSVLPFSEIILNPNYVGDKTMIGRQDMNIILRRFNEGLVSLMRADINFVRDKGILAQYWKAATVYCEEDRTSCAALNFFSQSSDSSLILEQYAWDVDYRLVKLRTVHEAKKVSDAEYAKERAQLILLKRNAILITMKVRNASEDSQNRLYLLYLMSASEYDEIPENLRSAELDDQHLRINERITEKLADHLKDEKFQSELLPFIKDKQIWRRFSLGNVRGQRKDFGSLDTAAKLVKLACKFYRESSDLKESMDSSLRGTDATGNMGFLAKLDQLKRSDQGVVFANMRMNFPFESNEQLFIIDQLYRGHWDASIAMECWNSRRAKMTRQELDADTNKNIELVQNYVRVELLNRIITTNQFMSTVFQPLPGQEKFSSKDIFFRAVDESRKLESMWTNMLSRVDVLQQFMNSATGEVDRNMQSEQYKQLLLMVGGLKNNIKLLAVYPNMLVLSYYLAAKNFSVDIPTWYGGTLKLDAEMVIKWIFGEGQEAARPLFNFGNDSRPILTFENLYAFFYALKTNSFNTFSNADLQASSARSAGEKIISDINFFAEVIRRYMNSEFLALDKEIKDLEDKQASTENFSRLKEICSAEGGKVSKVDNTDYKIDMALTDIDSHTFLKYDAKDSPAGVFQDLYGPTTDALEDMRLSIYRKFLFVNTMVEILDDHWKSQLEMLDGNAGSAANWRISVANYADAQNKISEVRGNFNELLDDVRRMQFFALSRHREVGNCMDIVDKVEYRQQYSLYEMEISFLRAVYASLREMNQEIAKDPAHQADIEALYTAAINGKAPANAPSDSNLAKLAELSKAYMDRPGDSFGQADGNVAAFDMLSKTGGFTYSHWNILLRLRNNLQAINPRITVTLPQKTAMIQMDAFAKATDPTNRVSVRFNENVTENQFVQAAMSSADNAGFINWWKETHTLGRYAQRLNLMLQLYMDESTGVFDVARKACAGKSDIPSCAAMKTTLAPIGNNEIIKEVFNIASLVNITPEDEKYLRLTGRPTKYERKEIISFFLDSREIPHSLFEVPYKVLSGGKSLVEPAHDAFVAFNAMLSTGSSSADDENKGSKELVFLADHDSVRKITRAMYRPIVTGTFDRVHRFEQSVNCYEQAHAQENPEDISYLYELNLTDRRRSAGKWINPNLDTGRTVYIENRLKDDFLNQMQDFAKDTKHVYDAMPGDPDYQKNTAQPTCEELLKD